MLGLGQKVTLELVFGEVSDRASVFELKWSYS